MKSLRRETGLLVFLGGEPVEREEGLSARHIGYRFCLRLLLDGDGVLRIASKSVWSLF